MDGYISYPRVDNTVYPSSLNLADTVRAIAGNPAYAPYCKELLAKASASGLHMGEPALSRSKATFR